MTPHLYKPAALVCETCGQPFSAHSIPAGECLFEPGCHYATTDRRFPWWRIIDMLGFEPDFRVKLFFIAYEEEHWDENYLGVPGSVDQEILKTFLNYPTHESDNGRQ